MASSIFDSLTGVSIDSHTAILHQSLLDQNSSTIGLSADSSIVAASETPITLDEEDVFQCGKCKKQFISLHMFLCHKKESSCVAHKSLIYQNGMDVMDDAAIVAATGNGAPSPTSEAFDVTQLEVGQPIILGEADMLSFSIDQNSLQLSSSSQALPSLSGGMQGSFLDSSSRETTYGDLKTPPCVHEVKSSSTGFNMNIGGQPIFVTTQLQGDIPSPTGGFVVTTSGPILSDTQVQAALPTDVGIGPALPGIESIPTSKRLVLSEANIKENDLLSSTLQALTDEGGGVHDEEVVGLVQENGTEVVSVGFLTVASTCTTPTDAPPEPPPPPPSKKKHKCDYCGKTFAKNFDFQQHMRSHTGERPFQCVVCGRAFSQKSNVKKHMLTHRVWPSGLTNTLPSEPIQVISLDNIEEDDDEEMKSEKSNGKDDNVQVIIDSSYVCQYCSRAFRSYLELKSHMKDHSNEKMFKCIQRKCGKTFADLDEFLVHTKSHSSEEVRYRCHVCCQIFKSLAELGTHQYTHLPSNNSNSSSSVENEGELSNGEMSKTGTSTSKAPMRQYRCGKCRSYFATPEALEHHNETATHHHPCPHCKRIFHCERYLRRHLVTHGTARILAPAADDPDASSPTLFLGSYKCDICSKKFRTERYMANHRLIHFETRPHSCSQCPASFNRRDKLMRHQLIHEPVKRYKCPFRHLLDCKKEFNRQDKLKLHVLTHNSVKRLNCTKCSRTFQRQNLLEEHEKNCKGETHESQPEESPSVASSGSLVNAEDRDGETSKMEKRSLAARGRGRGRRRRTSPVVPSKRKPKDVNQDISAEAKLPEEDADSEAQQLTDVVGGMVGEDGVPTIEIIVVPVSTDGGTVGVVGPYKIDFPCSDEYVEERSDSVTLWPD